MAGSMRKMAVYLGLVEDDDLYRENEVDDYDEPEPERKTRERRTPRRSTASEYRSVTVSEPPSSVRTFREERTPPRARDSEPRFIEEEIAPVRAAAPVGPDLYRITTIHPHTYNDARRIGEEFREGVPVIMNLTEMEDGDAKRIVDFAAGLVFGLHGTIERVTNKVFLLSPVNVDVAAEARAQLAQNGFFNQS
jgi:cell division inhibitor SepF